LLLNQCLIVVVYFVIVSVRKILDTISYNYFVTHRHCPVYWRLTTIFFSHQTASTLQNEVHRISI